MSIPDVVRERLKSRDGTTRIAVVGASDNPAKFGNIIPRDLLKKGYTVLPVNPRLTVVLDQPCVTSVLELAPPVHIVDFVLPPAASLEALVSIDPKSVECVWFQPGSFDAQVLAAARARFQNVIAGPCIMVETR